MQDQIKTIRNYMDGYKKISQQFICNQYSNLCRNLFSSDKSSIEITRTSSTLTYNNTKIVCSKKMQMRKIAKRQIVTKLKNISIDVSSIEIEDYQSSQQKQEDGKRLVSDLIKQALIILDIKFQEWSADWEKYTDDKKKLLFALKVIQIQYLKIKSEITDIMDNKRFKQFRDILDIDIKIPTPQDYVTAVFEQFPQIYDFFENFNLTCIASEGISEMKTLQLQTLPYLIQLDQQLVKRKKNKKKNKKKKKKNVDQNKQGINQINKQQDLQLNLSKEQSNEIPSSKNQDNEKYNQTLSFLENFSIKKQEQQDMQKVRVYDSWIQKIKQRNLDWKKEKQFNNEKIQLQIKWWE